MRLTERYAALVAQGRLEDDAAQRATAARLDALGSALEDYKPANHGGLIGWLAGRGHEAPRGLYIWGGVGRGKTMLMGLFHAAAPVQLKRRVHFHAFMQEVHARIHAFRAAQDRQGTRGDPVGPVAAHIAAEAVLLCFDEFVVTDIADAMLLGRLFAALFSAGTVVVATANVPPRGLYKDGLNRSLFLPSIALIEEHMEVMELAARTDFRLEKLAGAAVYHVPADAAARAALDMLFATLTGGQKGAPVTLTVLGRALVVPCAARGICRFSFDELCRRPLGAADYLALAHRFHTLFIDDLPIMAADERDVARRFISLIDTIYDHRVKLVASAAAQPNALYRATEGREAFEFLRVVSRLIDMRSADYLAHAHGRQAMVEAAGIVET